MIFNGCYWEGKFIFIKPSHTTTTTTKTTTTTTTTNDNNNNNELAEFESNKVHYKTLVQYSTLTKY